MKELWHRHLGVYGICINEGKILLIHKKGGPYTNRYDLPGGTVEPNEPLVRALHRELKEETGIDIKIVRNLGVRDFVVPDREERSTTHVHHIAIFYEVERVGGELTYSTDMLNNDSVGPEWTEISKLNAENSSPLVMQALEWLSDKNNFSFNTLRLDDWQVKQ